MAREVLKHDPNITQVTLSAREAKGALEGGAVTSETVALEATLEGPLSTA